jgi:hypothetical protein
MDERNKLIIGYMKEAQRIRESSGFKTLRILNSIRTSFTIYSENYRTLSKTLNDFYSSSNIISDNSVKRWRRQRIIVKDIHNLVSAAFSYVDHTKKKDCFKIVKTRIDEDFEQNQLYNFIRALRNFLIHQEPLYLISRQENYRIETGDILSKQYESMKNDSFEGYLSNSFINSKGKNTKDKMALDYLRSLPGYINLNTIFADYNSHITTFHHWFLLSLVYEQKDELITFLNNIDGLHKYALDSKLNPEYPITKEQVRHLKLLLSKCENR